jgi:hypothetical protein
MFGQIFGSNDSLVRRADKYAKYQYLEKNIAEASSSLKVYADNIVSGTIGGDECYSVNIDHKTKNLAELEQIVTDAEKFSNIKDDIWQIGKDLTRDGDLFNEVVIHDVGSGKRMIKKLKALPNREIEADVDEFGVVRDPLFPYIQRFENTQTPIKFDWWRLIHFKIGNGIYGVDNGLFANAAMRVGRQLLWADEALVLARLSRAWQRLAFLIDTGNLSPDDAFAYVQKYMTAVRSTKIISDSSRGKTDILDAPPLPDEDIGIPTGENSKADVKPISGDPNITRIDDITYLQNKFLMACTMPKAYVSLEEGVAGKSVIGTIDVQFARQVRRLQNSLKPGLKRYYELVFTLAGVDHSAFEWEIQFPELATVDEQLKWQTMMVKTQIASILYGQLGVVNTDYVLRELLSFSDDEVKKYSVKVLPPDIGSGTMGQIPGGQVNPAQAGYPGYGGQGATSQVNLPKEAIDRLRRDPQIRMALESIKDAVEEKYARDQMNQHMIRVGVDRRGRRY